MDKINALQIGAFVLFVIGAMKIGDALFERKGRWFFLIAGLACIAASVAIFYNVAKSHPEIFR